MMAYIGQSVASAAWFNMSSMQSTNVPVCCVHCHNSGLRVHQWCGILVLRLLSGHWAVSSRLDWDRQHASGCMHSVWHVMVYTCDGLLRLHVMVYVIVYQKPPHVTIRWYGMCVTRSLQAVVRLCGNVNAIYTVYNVHVHHMCCMQQL